MENDATGIYTQKKELETAFEDLQLAHSFLTKQFEKDRAEHIQNVEQLQNTNKELHQKILECHSNLSQSETKLQEMDIEVKRLKESSSLENDFVRNIDLSSPVPSPINLLNPESPTLSNGNGHSFSIMKMEFKRMLAESQRKYEREIQEERESRMHVEKELEAFKKKTGMK